MGPFQMRMAAGKIWIALALPLVLALSVFAAPRAGMAAPHADAHIFAEMEPGDGQSKTGHVTCHKAAACEAPAALERRHKAVFAGQLTRLVFSPFSSKATSALPQALLPPPKA